MILGQIPEPGFSDPANDHIALQQDGDLDHNGANNLAGPVILGNIEDGAFHPITISWNASTLNFRVFFDNVLAIDYTGDMVMDIFGGNAEVFWGFTSATGAANNDHRVWHQ